MMFEPPSPKVSPKVAKDKGTTKKKANNARRASMSVLPCERCKEMIDPMQVKPVTADNGSLRWHPDCFTCKECEEDLLANGFFIHEAEIYCDECMDMCHGTPCDACHKPIMQYSQNQEKCSTLDGSKHYHQKCVPLVGDDLKPPKQAKGRRKSTTACLFC